MGSTRLTLHMQRTGCVWPLPKKEDLFMMREQGGYPRNGAAAEWSWGGEALHSVEVVQSESALEAIQMERVAVASEARGSERERSEALLWKEEE